MGFFNPFHTICESPDNRASRFLRTGFWQKIQKTFYAFAGEFFHKGAEENKNHIGILDIITVGGSCVFFCIGRNLGASRSRTVKALGFPLAILGLLLLAVKYVVAAALTLSVGVLVGIVSLAAKAMSYKLKQKAYSLSIKPLVGNNTQCTLQQYLKNNKIDVEQINVEYQHLGPSRVYTLRFSKTSCAYVDRQYTTGSLRKENEDFRALVRLNIGGLFNKIAEKDPTEAAGLIENRKSLLPSNS